MSINDLSFNARTLLEEALKCGNLILAGERLGYNGKKIRALEYEIKKYNPNFERELMKKSPSEQVLDKLNDIIDLLTELNENLGAKNEKSTTKNTNKSANGTRKNTTSTPIPGAAKGTKKKSSRK